MTGIGEGGLGAFARSQIADARSDPRLARKRGAMIADFRAAMEEAERVRTLGIMGLHELTHTVERHERLLGVSRDDENLPPDVARTLQAAWERAESARVEIANDHPQLNAQALVSMKSALDALVEEWVPAMRSMRARWLADRAIEQADAEGPARANAFTSEVRETLVNAVRDFVEKKLGKVKRLEGSGSNRYETLLAQEGLGEHPERPIPADLDIALTEVSAIRNVLIHKAGRIDPKALEYAPSLAHRYQDGEFVRISGDDYRMYSAAIRCYATEIQFRPLQTLPGADKHKPDLTRWRDYYVIGA